MEDGLPKTFLNAENTVSPADRAEHSTLQPCLETAKFCGKPTETNGPGFMIRRLQQVSVSFFHDQLRPLCLTPLQATVLRALGKEDGLDQVSLATRAVVDASTIKDVVQRLEQNNAVKRERSTIDKRMQLVYLTDTGRKLLKKSTPLAKVAAQKLLAPLSEEEKSQLLKLVAKVVDAHDPEPEPGSRATWRRKKTAS